MNEDETIREFLGERPAAAELRGWRDALERRLEALEGDRTRTTGPAAASLESKIAQLKRQITALQEEEAITQFVEDSVRVTLAMGAVSQGMDDEG